MADSEIIRLRSFHLASLHLQCDPFEATGAKAEQETVGPFSDVTYQLYKVPEPCVGVLRLGLRGAASMGQVGGVPPLRYEATVLGVFEHPKSWDEDRAGAVLRLQGGSMLYGIARGLIHSSTASCLAGPILLPTLNWHEVVKTVEGKAGTAGSEAGPADPRPEGTSATVPKAPRKVPATRKPPTRKR